MDFNFGGGGGLPFFSSSSSLRSKEGGKPPWDLRGGRVPFIKLSAGVEAVAEASDQGLTFLVHVYKTLFLTFHSILYRPKERFSKITRQLITVIYKTI